MPVTEFSQDTDARDEIQRTHEAVGQQEDVAERIRLEKEYEAQPRGPQGNRRRAQLRRQMRVLAPPTEAQIDLSRAKAIGIVVGVGALTAIAGQQTADHITAVVAAKDAMGNAIDKFNFINAQQTMHTLYNDGIAAAENTAIAVAAGIGTVAGIATEVKLVFFSKIWHRPKRRGRIFAGKE